MKARVQKKKRYIQLCPAPESINRGLVDFPPAQRFKNSAQPTVRIKMTGFVQGDRRKDKKKERKRERERERG